VRLSGFLYGRLQLMNCIDYLRILAETYDEILYGSQAKSGKKFLRDTIHKNTSAILGKYEKSENRRVKSIYGYVFLVGQKIVMSPQFLDVLGKG
jgi:hypothetical protein